MDACTVAKAPDLAHCVHLAAGVAILHTKTTCNRMACRCKRKTKRNLETHMTKQTARSRHAQATTSKEQNKQTRKEQTTNEHTTRQTNQQQDKQTTRQTNTQETKTNEQTNTQQPRNKKIIARSNAYAKFCQKRLPQQPQQRCRDNA